MTDNVLQTLQQLVQDVIAPDVRELKVRLSELEKRMDSRFNEVLAAIALAKAEGAFITMHEIASLRERVAILETTKH